MPAERAAEPAVAEAAAEEATAQDEEPVEFYRFRVRTAAGQEMVSAVAAVLPRQATGAS
jgi:hypothetical protein